MPRAKRPQRRSCARHPVFSAIERGAVDSLASMLAEDPMLAFQRDPHKGESTLHAAARSHSYALEILLKSPCVKTPALRRALLDRKDKRGRAPVHVAAACLNVLGIGTLAEWGADFTATRNDGKTAEAVALSQKAVGYSQERLKEMCAATAMVEERLQRIEPRREIRVIRVPYDVARGLATLELWANESRLELFSLTGDEEAADDSPQSDSIQAARKLQSCRRLQRYETLLHEAYRLHDVPPDSFMYTQANGYDMMASLCAGLFFEFRPVHHPNAITHVV